MATSVGEGTNPVQINEINEIPLNEQTRKTNCLSEKLSSCTRNVFQKCCQFWTTRCCNEIKLIIKDAATGAIIAVPAALVPAYVFKELGITEVGFKFDIGEAIAIPCAVVTGCLAKRVVERTWVVYGSILGIIGGTLVATLVPISLGTYTVTVILSGSVGGVVGGILDRLRPRIS